MNPALLVLTVGQTDVQLVENGCRREFSKRCCAALHEQIEQRTGDWRVVDPPLDKSEEKVETLPNGSFELCTPKLDAVLQYLEKKGVLPTDALILETRRDSEKVREDPRAAGLVLERRLCEWFGSRIEVTRSAYLKGAERLEDRNDARDAIIRREIVSRINDAIRTAMAKISGSQIVIATTGGFPKIAELVDEVVRLYAGRGNSVDLIEVPEPKPRTQDQAVPRQSVPEPVESYRARRYALSLIEDGNLVAAWGAVQHLTGDAVEQKWTRVVEWLYHFAASLPIPEKCDIPVLRHPRMAVRTGLRVELALRAGDIPRAVHGTVAFFEAALWDHLLPHIRRHPEKPRLFALDPSPSENLVRSGNINDSERLCGTWYRIYDDDVCAIRIAKHYLNNSSLQNLGQEISKIRELRNDVAHNEPTPELMADSRQKMAYVKLWSNDGAQFLTQPLIQDVLNELGVTAPETLCEDLIKTVRSRLVQPT
jgi:hypothetical protein